MNGNLGERVQNHAVLVKGFDHVTVMEGLLVNPTVYQHLRPLKLKHVIFTHVLKVRFSYILFFSYILLKIVVFEIAQNLVNLLV